VDVFICDLNIDHQDGFELIENLRPAIGDSKVIILSAYFEEYLIHKARKHGVFAFLKKETTVEELIDVIDRNEEEGFYSQPTPLSKQNAFLNQDENFVNKFKLSKQEREIIKWIVQGKLSKEIGDLLFISKTTVDTHRRNINRKLNVSSVGELIKFANENNLA
jgi:DNA-binding NarL/FixJ family response regulator